MHLVCTLLHFTVVLQDNCAAVVPSNRSVLHMSMTRLPILAILHVVLQPSALGCRQPHDVHTLIECCPVE